MAEKHAGGRKITQTERAYEHLKRAIVRGELPEGEFISEPEVMRRYGIGRTPFREACNRLHHEGLLEVVPRRGYLAPEISFRAVRDLCEARLVLEGSIAELAAVRATDEEIAELEELSRKLAALGEGSNDLDKIIRTNNEFHLLLARMARNRELLKLLSWNLDQTERLMYMELRSSRTQRGDVRGFHAAIAAAIRKRDAGGAREAVIRDITDAQEATFGRLSPVPGRAHPKA